MAEKDGERFNGSTKDIEKETGSILDISACVFDSGDSVICENSQPT